MTSLFEQGFTLVETGTDSGIFVGSSQVPSGQTGKDIEVTTTTIVMLPVKLEVGDGAAVNANTGTVEFDRTVYPVPGEMKPLAKNSVSTEVQLKILLTQQPKVVLN